MYFQIDFEYGQTVTQRKKNWGGRRKGAGRKPEMEDPVTYAAPIERAEIDALRAIAERRGVSTASLVRKAISAYLKRQQRIE